MLRRLAALWERLPVSIRQFVKFGMVGMSNTLIGLGVNYLCLLALGVQYLLSNAAGFFVSVINAYYWNSRYVFRAGKDKPRSGTRAFAKTAFSYGSTFLLGLALNFLMVERWGVPVEAAPALILCVTVPLNFFMNKLWAFR